MKFKEKKRPFAKKSFGQNFLTDDNVVDRIVSALKPQNEDFIVEIGPGRGALTEKLCESGARVCAVELDRDLIPLLEENFAGYENFSIVHQDALRVDFRALQENHASEFSNTKSIKLVANLPYNISTAILQRLIEQRESFSEMVLMFQREVVDRITAAPGTSERGFLTVLVEAYLEAEKLFDVSPRAFRPIPKVWSSIARLVPKEKVEIPEENLFRDLISIGFAQRRKTILNNLKNAHGPLKEKLGDPENLLNACDIDPRRRAETLTVDEWTTLLKTLL